ncbi:hypothetical protein A1Q1_01521 [Trichosporon asahii var. asahii CBS 2479]|uniref:Uncharacterized protein n=1 Tax=Trichosporon asahii var. asahii (strain ATCC 90039 / CBS 2479 / JCM 2466 / KCTC 7840 / NBRC 103889/ NCYC 2677 / UAMH 7654) TaxID=1186058 RepID=J6EXE0_TRIAS|nr:hypothetical protein A1Q1_01521 [Trichosporon asahii var. asahii CBS 2479]EJT49319.1 hypothetical protein A1Q1_01521 [Trichosporon asahii var. asahii CBS 2479]
MSSQTIQPKATHSVPSFYREDETGMETESEADAADFSDSDGDNAPCPVLTRPNKPSKPRSVPRFYRENEDGLVTESEAEFSDSDGDNEDTEDEGEEYTTEGAYVAQYAYTYIEVEETAGIEEATQAMEIDEGGSESEAAFTDGEEGESTDEEYVDESREK